MKPLIGIINCHSRTDYQQAIRDTWLKHVPKDKADVRFFLGVGAAREPKDDEVFLSVPDDYYSIPEKAQAMFKWAFEHGYSNALKCDDDVVLKPESMLASDCLEHDFVGPRNPNGKLTEIHTPWGFCYWLNRKAMEMVINAPLPGRPGSTHSYYHANDEAWISTVLHVNGIFLHDDQRYFLHRGAPQNNRPLQRPLRSPKRPEPFGLVAPTDTFAWCMYLDLGQHTTPIGRIIEEFYKVYEETQKNVNVG
jgi:hypothetical protein